MSKASSNGNGFAAQEVAINPTRQLLNAAKAHAEERFLALSKDTKLRKLPILFDRTGRIVWVSLLVMLLAYCALTKVHVKLPPIAFACIRYLFDFLVLVAFFKIVQYFVFVFRQIFDASQNELFDFVRAVATSDADEKLRAELAKVNQKCIKRAVETLRYYRSDFQNWQKLVINALEGIVAFLITLGFVKQKMSAGWLRELSSILPLWALFLGLMFAVLVILLSRFNRLQASSRTIQIFEEYLPKSDRMKNDLSNFSEGVSKPPRPRSSAPEKNYEEGSSMESIIAEDDTA